MNMSNLQEPKRPLKILCVTSSFPESPDNPAGFFVYQLALALSKQHASVRVLTPAGRNAKLPWPNTLNVLRFGYAPRRWQRLAQFPGGIPVALRQTKLSYLLIPGFLASFAFHLIMLARESDVILANWAVCGAIAGWLYRFHRLPIISVLRGSDIQFNNPSHSTRFTLREAFRSSRAVVSVGEEITDFIRAQSPLPERVFHIPNGIHDEFFRLDPPEPKPMAHALFIGSLIPRKGPDVLLQAMAKLTDVNMRLTVVGKGPMEQSLKEQSEKMGIQKQVSFIGEVPPGRPIADLMKTAHFLVLPSHHEGRPNVVIEAMAACRPVIGSRIHGIRECVDQSGGGALFLDGDEQGLAEIMRSMACQLEKAVELGQKGRDWILSQGLTWDNTASQYLSLMQEVMSEKRV